MYNHTSQAAESAKNSTVPMVHNNHSMKIVTNLFCDVVKRSCRRYQLSNVCSYMQPGTCCWYTELFLAVSADPHLCHSLDRGKVSIPPTWQPSMADHIWRKAPELQRAGRLWGKQRDVSRGFVHLSHPAQPSVYAAWLEHLGPMCCVCVCVCVCVMWIYAYVYMALTHQWSIQGGCSGCLSTPLRLRNAVN